VFEPQFWQERAKNLQNEAKEFLATLQKSGSVVPKQHVLFRRRFSSELRSRTHS